MAVPSATSDVVAESKRAKCGVGAAAIGSRSGCSKGPNIRQQYFEHQWVGCILVACGVV